jgi:hypothetical protein
MKIDVTTIGDSIESFASKTGKQTVRRVLMLDADVQSNLGQVLELDLPADHAAVGVGKRLQIECKGLPVNFTGRVRVRGNLVAAKG